jgi:23S rRNA pseudouridine1911/1915/1917 synthase
MNSLQMKVDEQFDGMRIDKVLPKFYPEHTRNFFHNLLDGEFVTVNGKTVKPSVKIRMGDLIEINFPELQELKIEAKNIPLDVVYEDQNILVINKQPGLVVHPGTHGSHSDDSLVNAILHHCAGSLGGINGTVRPGIVHRLDKDTSGLMVVAKNDLAQQFLMTQFQKRTVSKVYYALLAGHLEPEKGTIDAPIGRSMQDRKRMAVSQGKTSKEAISKYEVIRYFGDYTYVRVFLLTGRTHQIRVHFSAIGFPLVGDETYGREKINHQFEQHYGLKRQFLHAAHLSFTLPPDGGKATTSVAGEIKAGASGRGDSTKRAEFESALPADLQSVLDGLENEAERS